MTRTYSAEDLDASVYKPLIQTVSIDSGETTSSAVDLGGAHLFAIGLGTMTGSSLSFKVSADNSTFNDLYDEYGSKYSISIGSNRVIFLNPMIFSAIRYLKLVSGSSEGADRTISLFTRTV